MAVVLFAQISSQATGGMSGYIYFKPPMGGVFPRSVNGSEMSFSAVDGMITALSEQFDERGSDKCIGGSGYLADSVVVPVWWLYCIDDRFDEKNSRLSGGIYAVFGYGSFS